MENDRVEEKGTNKKYSHLANTWRMSGDVPQTSKGITMTHESGLSITFPNRMMFGEVKDICFIVDRQLTHFDTIRIKG